MKLAFSSNGFRKHKLTEAIEILAAIGYDGIEIMADRPHAWPPDVRPEDMQAIRETLQRYKMSISNVNAFMTSAIQDFHHPSWIEPDPAYRQKRVNHTLACIDLAAQLGAKTISTEPGGPLPYGMTRSDALEIFRRGLQSVVPLAEQRGVKVLIEPEPGLLIENSRQYEEFISAVDSPSIGLNFDMGHFYCVGEDLPELVRRFGQRIEHIHCEDIKADREHFHHVPGDGAIHYPSFFQALKDVGYPGWITIELYPFLDNASEVSRRAYELIRPYVTTAA